MFEILEDILLSQFLMFIVLAVMLAALSSWAMREREYAGYALGWLMGILMIIIYQAATGGETTGEEAEEVVETTRGGLSFMAVIIPAILGIVAGYGGLFFMNAFNRTHRRRAITIAILTSSLVLALYFVLGLSDNDSRVIGIFALAFAIGALFNTILNSTTVPTRYGSQRVDELPAADTTKAESQFSRFRRR